MIDRTVINNLSDEAKAVSVMERDHKDHRGHDVQEVNFHIPGTDFTLGTKVKNAKMILLHIGSGSHEHARQGHGFPIMQRAIKYAADHNLRFFINEFVPDEAWPLVHKLIRRGYAVHEPGEREPITHHLSFGESPSLEIGTVPTSFTPFKADWH